MICDTEVSVFIGSKCCKYDQCKLFIVQEDHNDEKKYLYKY